MKDLAIYGAGGFGREVACLVNLINEKENTWNLLGFFDDNPLLKGREISHYGPCFGGIDVINSYDSDIAIVVAIGSPSGIRKIVSEIENPRVSFPNIIHPGILLSDSDTFIIGKGNIIQGGCVFSCDVEIRDFNVFNDSTVIGHDSKIGSYNVFMPAVRVSGEVTIGNENLFGVRSTIIQCLTIGDNTKLAAGSVLMTNPKDKNLYLGIPARKVVF